MEFDGEVAVTHRNGRVSRSWEPEASFAGAKVHLDWTILYRQSETAKLDIDQPMLREPEDDFVVSR